MKLILLGLIALIFAPITWANEATSSAKFSLKFDNTYKVHDSGLTTVSQDFSLTNLQSDTFASEYRLALGKTQVRNLRAFDRTGALPLDLLPTGDGNFEVRINFRDLAVGKTTTLNWSVVYETSDLATSSGGVWAVTIPSPLEPKAATDYTVKLEVPPSFGPPVFIKPTASAIGNFWHKEQLGGRTITALFAPSQTATHSQSFDFLLKYRLTNHEVLPRTLSLALPPDTPYQTIFLNFLNPRPLDVVTGLEGNWLAKYRVAGLSSLNVVASGSALISARPIYPEKTAAPEKFLGFNTVWTKSRETEKIADSLKDIAAIYDFVASNIQLDTSQVVSSFKPAGEILAGLPNKGSCFDAATIFITLARLKNIPARQVDGLVIPQTGQKITKLHCWVQYFDYPQGKWIMVDPTWESATGLDYFHSLDFNHLALAIHGQNPTSPLPAGLYQGDFPTDNITVTPAKTPPVVSAKTPIVIRADIPKMATSGLTYTAKIFLENTTPVAQEEQTLYFSSPQLALFPQVVKTGVLPPFASREITLSLAKVPFNQARDVIISLRVGANSRDYQIAFRPLYTSRWLVVVGALTILGCLSIIAQITRSVLLQKQKRGSDLRGQGQKSA